MFCSIKRAAGSRPAFGACLAVLMLLAYMPASQAALTLSGTRVVFDSDKRNVSLVVSNPSDKVFAVQTWVNTDDDDSTSAVPFIASPPLFRINQGKEQHVQINGLPNDLPSDRESLFFFNVQEIPQAEVTDGNVLNIALRTRIKLFYRPAQLKDNPVSRLKDLQWSIENIGGQRYLVVNNPTPFHVTFAHVELTGDAQPQSLASPGMALPKSRHLISLPASQPAGPLQVRFSAINDYGGVTPPLDLPLEKNQ